MAKKKNDTNISGVSKSIVEGIKDKKVKSEEVVEFLSSGSTLLDLVLGGGYPKGRMVNIVGDKSSGKTLLATEFLAHNHKLLKKGFSWTYDDAEAGFNFNTKAIYGIELLDPDYEASDTIEKFEYNVEKVLTKKSESIHAYILDSFDAIGSDAENKKYKQKINAIKKRIEDDENEKVKGEYGMDKQKECGKFFRVTCRKIKDREMILAIISQVREKIGIMFGEKYTRSGGKALDFYAAQIIWLSEAAKIIKSGTPVGIRIKVKNKKNKVGKPFRECFVDILFDYGIDNVSTNINYLYDLVTPKGEYKPKKIEWEVKDKVEEFTPAGLIKHIEENNLEKVLAEKVIKKWNDFEESISAKDRKRKW